jgi:hypothetical protein
VKRRQWRVAALALALLARGGNAAEPVAPTDLAAWVTRGTPILDLRLRNEAVDDEAYALEAHALTLRSRIGWQTAALKGWSMRLVGSDIRALRDDYNSTVNGRTTYPTVADPQGTDIDQAVLAYAANRFAIAAGRQRLAFDNERFIGPSAWRQREQTFDSASLSWTPRQEARLAYVYLDRVRRVNDATINVAGHLLHTSWKVPGSEFTAYGYFIQNQTQPTLSARTLGLRYTGERTVRPAWQASWTLEAADQAPYQGSDAFVSAHYTFAEIALAHRKFSLRLGGELLSGNGHYGFATPFATLHAFNGWDDKFLTTPANGLRDLYLGGALSLEPVKLVLVAHRFDADLGGLHYGDEFDVSASVPFDKHWAGLLKAARYRADGLARDTEKLWLSLEFKL